MDYKQYITPISPSDISWLQRMSCKAAHSKGSLGGSSHLPCGHRPNGIKPGKMAIGHLFISEPTAPFFFA